MLTLGGQYRPIEGLKVAASWHYFFDKSAKKFADKQNTIDGNTMEFMLSAEYKFCKWVAASFSWQNTIYDLKDSYMSDMDFNMTNHSIGMGVRVYPCDLLSIDLGYMHTFYPNTPVGTSVYSRTNDVVGVGLNFAF